MKRRAFLSLSALTVFAGCSTSTEISSLNQANPGEETDAVGGLIAEDIPSSPDDAMVVDATSGRLASLEVVQTVVSRAANDKEDYALLKLDKTQLEDVENALTELPEYTGENGPPGYYLNYNTDTLLLYPFYI